MMAGVPSQPNQQMDEPYWRGVVLKWVECSGLIKPGESGIDLDACYDAFRSKLKGTHELAEATVVEFMRAKFPHFELRLGPDNAIRECDHMYVFSLMLYYSCIRQPVPYFQNICKEFDEPFQHSVKAFLNAFVPSGGKTVTIDRALLGKACGKAKRSACQDVPCRPDSVQMITSTPNGKGERKKPSPVTPQSVVLEWKVKNLSALLASARAENSTQEKQIEQLLQSVQTLEDERKRNLSKISALELREPCAWMTSATNGSPHSPARSTGQLQKQIKAKDQLIETLEDELSRAREAVGAESERYMAMKKQWATLKEDHQLMTMTHQALREELAAKDTANQHLAETVDDLRRFIRETHVANGQLIEPLESSFDLLERSFKNVTPSDNASYNEQESLAATVVDVKLKEKEHENETLTRQVQELQEKLAKQCAAHSGELARLKASLNQEKHELRQMVDSIEQTKKELADNLQIELAKVNDLTRRNQALKDEKKRVTGEFEAAKVLLTNKNEQLQKRFLKSIEHAKTQLTDNLKKALAKEYELTRRIQELEDGKKQLQEEFEAAKVSMIKKNELLQQKLESVEQKKTQLADKLEKELVNVNDLTRRNQELENEKKRLTEEFEASNASMIKKNEQLQQKLEAIEETKTQLADKLEKELVNVNDLNRQNQELENEKKRLTEEFEASNASMIKQNEQLQQTLLKSIEQAKTQLAENLEKELIKVNDLTRQNQELEDEKKQLTEEFEASNASMIKKNEQLQQKLESVEQTKTQLADKLEKELVNVNDLTRRNQELENEKKRLTEEFEVSNATMIKKNEQLQQMLESIEQTKTQLADNLEKELAKVEDLTRRNQELEDEKKQLTEKFEASNATMNKKNEQLQQKLASVEQTKTQLADKLEKELVNVNDLNRQNQELENEKKRLTEEFEASNASMIKQNEQLQQTLLKSIEQAKTQLAENLEKELIKVNDLTRQNQELEDEKKQLTEEFEASNASMIKKNEQLQQKLESVEQTKTQLADKLEKELVNVNDLTRRNQELENEKKRLTEEFEVSNATMIKKNEQLQQMLESIEQTKTQLADNLEKELAKVEDLTRRNQELEDEKKQLTEKFEASNATMNKKNEQLQQKLASVEQTRAQLADKLEMELVNVNDLTRRNQELENEKKRLTEEFEASKATMIKKNEQLQQMLESVEQTKTQLADNLEKELAKVDDLTRRNQELEDEKKQLTEEFEASNATMNKKNEQLQQKLESVEQTKTQLADKLEKELVNVNDLTRRNQELENEKKRLTEEFEVSNATMIKKNEQLQQMLESIEQTKTQLADNLEKELAKVEDLTRRNQELEDEKKQLTEKFEASNATMNKKNEQLQQKLASVEQTKTQLADKLEKELVNVNDLNRRNQELENEKKRLTEEFEVSNATMIKKNEQLQQMFESVEQTKTQLADNLEKELAKVEDLTRRNQELEDEKKQLTEDFEAAKLLIVKDNEEVRQALESNEQTKKQLADKLEKELAKIDVLTRRNQVLEDEKNRQKDEFEATKASMLQENAEVRRTLESIEQTKIQLEDKLRKELATLEDVKHQLMEKEEAKVLGETLADNRQAEMLAKISLLQQKLEEEREKSEELNCQYVSVKKQADDLGVQCTKLMASLSENRTEVADLEKLKEQHAKEQTVAKEELQKLQALYETKDAEYKKCKQDCETLAVKLMVARRDLKKQIESDDQKMRETIISHHSTMDKMKNKMVLLHEESIKKLEFDKKGMAATIDGYQRKLENLETRCTLLQKQLAEMNERNLETRKENQLLQIKLKTMEEHGSERKSVLMPSQSSLRSNLQMEDEVGELFDNRYLVELKNGRSTPPDPTSGNHDRYTELYGRNSKLLPHLRTNYEALAPDCMPPADDTGDNISTTFDDSSTGLISRRKVSGITSYKRPGPPTPSKRAGRLSLNGVLLGGSCSTSEVQYRDALRDTNANAAAGDESITRLGRTKTPGKFKQMMSASSLLSNFQPRDENTSPKRRLSWFNKGKKY